MRAVVHTSSCLPTAKKIFIFISIICSFICLAQMCYEKIRLNPKYNLLRPYYEDRKLKITLLMLIMKSKKLDTNYIVMSTTIVYITIVYHLPNNSNYILFVRCWFWLSMLCTSNCNLVKLWKINTCVYKTNVAYSLKMAH